MSIFDPNDERLTAYILGDDSLSADDKAAIAELLATDAEAQRFANELMAAASLAGAELAADAMPMEASGSGIETAVRQALTKPAPKKFFHRVQWLVAAGLLVGLGIYFAPKIQRDAGPQMAMHEANAKMAPPAAAARERARSEYKAESWDLIQYGEAAPKAAAQSAGKGDAGKLDDTQVFSFSVGIFDDKAGVRAPSPMAGMEHFGTKPSTSAAAGGVAKGAVPDEPPITYLNPRAWEELPKRELGYKSAELPAGGTVADPASRAMGRGRGAEGVVALQTAPGMEPPASGANVKDGESFNGTGVFPARNPPAGPAAQGLAVPGQQVAKADELRERTDEYSKSLGERNMTVDAPQARFQQKGAASDILRRGGEPAKKVAEGLEQDRMKAVVDRRRMEAASVAPKSLEKEVLRRSETKEGDKPTVLAVIPKPGAGEAPAPSPDLPSLKAGVVSAATVAKPTEPKPLSKVDANVLTDEKVLAELDGVKDGTRKDVTVLADLEPKMAPTPPPARTWAFREQQEHNREAYPVLVENDFLGVQQNPLSTFSIDVDTASYANVRRFLSQNALPPPGAVRLEEMVNYFHYDYPAPTGETPFSAALEVAECPWNPEHRLARIALKGREIDRAKRPPSNLVFLIDVSGSMDEPAKLPLVKESLKLLVAQLGENDRVAIAVYASGSGLVLDSTNGSRKADIMYAIDNLVPSGSTNGAAGIKCAYDAAVKGFIKGGVNRVLLCTDGDFNVGVTSDDELVKLITEKAKSGVFLTTLAVGDGNLQDKKMMELADKGNGNYHYLDSIKEAQKVLVEQMSGTLVTIAKDVKIQVEFNPEKVGAYRLLGYEKRMLKTEDFKDDKKDAGEIGAGHTVTAFYELVPAGKTSPAGKTDPLVFQKAPEPAKVDAELAKSTCVVKLRYKQPDANTSTEVRFTGFDEGKKYTQASDDFRFAAAAASFAMILRESPYKGNANLAAVEELAKAAKGADKEGYRAEFLKLVAKAKEIAKEVNK